MQSTSKKPFQVSDVEKERAFLGAAGPLSDPSFWNDLAPWYHKGVQRFVPHKELMAAAMQWALNNEVRKVHDIGCGTGLLGLEFQDVFLLVVYG